jgi:16S rRNA (uracil1498-N3)-methyltransferase
MPSAASDAARAPRIHCQQALAPGAALDLPPGAARHVQVLRLQPGAGLILFDGRGGEWRAVVRHMGRSNVQVRLESHDPVEREARRAMHLAVGMPANERMDWLVEKATELGAASIQPLLAQRSVVRLVGERAARKQAHWHGVAVAACEQCGRNRVPVVHPPVDFPAWLQALASTPATDERWVLSLDADAERDLPAAEGQEPITLLSGPEGGLTPAEEAAARAAGFRPLSLGERVLRAETAPLVALARWAQ